MTGQPSFAPRTGLRLATALAFGVLAACGDGADRPSAPEPGVDPEGERAQAAGAEPADLDERIRALEEIGYAAGYEPAEAEHGVTFHAEGRAAPGLNLVVSGHAAEAYLMSLDGEVRHRWARSFEDTWPGRKGNRTRSGSWRRAHVLEDGGLLAVFTSLGLVRLDRDSNLVWAWEGRAHHDLDVGPDGSIYVLTRKASLIPAHHPSDPVLEDFVTRFSADGTELETVSIRDCLARSEFASELDAIRVGGDVFHTNSVQLLDDRGAALGPAGAAAFPEGGVLVSVRQLDLLAALDLERRTVTWARRGSWRRQHEPTLLPGGTMLVFDNLSVPRRSGVLEFDPLTGEQLWLYRAAVDDAFFTSGAGTCQRLANGNTLICASNAGRAFEVSPQREVVWEWKTPHRVEGPDGEALAATLFDLHRLDAAFPLDWLR